MVLFDEVWVALVETGATVGHGEVGNEKQWKAKDKQLCGLVTTPNASSDEL